MRILTAVFLVAMAGFVGCGGQGVRWYNPDRTLKQAEEDCRECHYQAEAESIEAAIVYHRTYGGRGAGLVYIDLQFDRCMKHKGYRLVPEDELSFPTRKRLFQVAGEWYYPIAGN